MCADGRAFPGPAGGDHSPCGGACALSGSARVERERLPDGSASFTNLLAAEDYAGIHAQYVSNSWGGAEFSGENANDSHFAAPGVSYFVSSGDAGTPAEYPSASPNVISVGGTTLHFASGALTGETGWSG